MKYLLSLLLLLFLSVPVLAQLTYSNGYVDINGYVFRDQYWWKNGNQYHRSIFQGAGWYNGCYYQPGQSYYQYHAYTPALAPVVNYKDSNWRDTVAKTLAERDRVDGQIKKEEYEHKNFIETIQVAGLNQSSFRLPNAAALQTYLGPYSYSGQYNFGVNGSTQYGLGYNALAQIYGDNNQQQMLQHASQLTANAQKLSGDALGGFQSIVAQDGANRAKLAESLIRVDSVLKIYNAITNDPKLSSYSFKIEPSTGTILKDDSKADPALKTSLRQQWGDFAAAKCATCHNPEKKEGGFDVGTYLSMSQQEKQNRVWIRLNTEDATKRMPKGGAKLTDEELKLWYMN